MNTKTYASPPPITQVIESDDAQGVLTRYSNVDVTQKGRRYYIRCPFHNDNNPSMSALQGGKFWSCWTCGELASSVDVIAKLEGATAVSVALEILRSNRFTLPKREVVVAEPVEPPNALMNGAALAYAHCQIPSHLCNCIYHRKFGWTARSAREREQAAQAINYMRLRGIEPRTAGKLALGIGSCSNHSLVTFLHQWGFSEDTPGWDKLFFPPNEEKGWGQSFRFKGYLIFGEPRARGEISWLCGRSYLPNAGLPHNHQAGKPTDLVLGASRLPAENYTVLLTEGTIDWALAKQWGYDAICVNGTGNAIETQREASNIANVVRGARQAIVVMDNDSAGEDASNKLLKSLGVLLGERVKPAVLPDGFNDIGDIGRESDGKQIFDNVIKQTLDAKSLTSAAELPTATCSN